MNANEFLDFVKELKNGDLVDVTITQDDPEGTGRAIRYQYRDCCFFSKDSTMNLSVSLQYCQDGLAYFGKYTPIESSTKLYVDLPDAKNWEEHRNWGPECSKCGTDIKYYLEILTASKVRTNPEQRYVEITVKEINE